MGFKFSPEKLRAHFGPNSFCFCPEARIERLIRFTIQEADECGFNGVAIAMDLYGVGTRYGDLLVLLRVDRSHPQWTAAAQRACRRVPGLLANPRAREALREWARFRDRSPKAVIDDFAPEAVLLALSRRSEPQRVCLSHGYVKDWHGSVARIAPNSPWLSLGEFERWLMKEIRNALESILLDDAYPKNGRDPLDDAEQVGAVNRVRERQMECTPRVSATMSGDKRRMAVRMLLERLSPREKDVYFAWRDTPGATSAEMGELLGMAPGTVRVHMHRIREKARELYPIGNASAVSR